MITERRFSCAPLSVPEARHFVADSVAHVSPRTLETALLIVSELATNCVSHAKTAFEVTIDQTEGNLRITVTDSGTGSPEVQWPPATEHHGRGLQIVEELAQSWGVRGLSTQGKQVWFTLALDQPVASSK